MSDERAALLRAATDYSPATGFPLLAMKVFADWLDENGEPALAFAYRWAGHRGVFPRPSPQGRRWTFLRFGKAAKKFRQPWELPALVYDLLARGSQQRFWYAHPADAFAHLAEALATINELLTW